MSLFNALVWNIQFVYIINGHGLGEVTHRLWLNPTQPMKNFKISTQPNLTHGWTRPMTNYVSDIYYNPVNGQHFECIEKPTICPNFHEGFLCGTANFPPSGLVRIGWGGWVAVLQVASYANTVWAVKIANGFSTYVKLCTLKADTQTECSVCQHR